MMSLIAKLLIIVSALFVFMALLIKATTVGKIVPGPLPLNWLKLAETVLFFSIAISLANNQKK
jgi:putative Ca2+/H+ antiporter (TMEM165/GDT1 family)